MKLVRSLPVIVCWDLLSCSVLELYVGSYVDTRMFIYGHVYVHISRNTHRHHMIMSPLLSVIWLVYLCIVIYINSFCW